MEAYSIFSEVYDRFMEDVPYDAWCGNLTGFLKKEGITDGLVLELGCGTGQMTRRLKAAGFDMIGVDASGEMLLEAAEKNDGSILYLNQDMRSFELYGTVRAIVSVCDSMNYLLTAEDLLEVLKLADNYLDPNGLFIFDMNTIHKYRDTIGEQTIYEGLDDACFVWENFYDEESGINEYDLTFFIEEGGEGLYRRYEETHLQRAFEIEEVCSLIGEAGLALVGVCDADVLTRTGELCAPTEETERVYFIAREQKKGRL